MTESAPTTPIPTEPSVEVLNKSFQTIIGSLQQWRTDVSQMIKDVRKLQNTCQREMKIALKKPRTTSTAKRVPSGFAKPTTISKELCSFLGKPSGTEMARTEVTKYLTQYIKEHQLQNEKDKRHIMPDRKLQKLLHCTKKDEVTYFNLQKWMKPHFAPSSQ